MNEKSKSVFMAIDGTECQIFPTHEMAKSYGHWESITEMIPATELTRLTSLLEECERALEFYSWDGQVKPDDGKLADSVLTKLRASRGKET